MEVVAPIADADLMNMPTDRLLQSSTLGSSALKVTAYHCRNALSLHVAATHIMKGYAAIFSSPAPKAVAALRVDVVYFVDVIHRQDQIHPLYVFMPL